MVHTYVWFDVINDGTSLGYTTMFLLVEWASQIHSISKPCFCGNSFVKCTLWVITTSFLLIYIYKLYIYVYINYMYIYICIIYIHIYIYKLYIYTNYIYIIHAHTHIYIYHSKSILLVIRSWFCCTCILGSECLQNDRSGCSALLVDQLSWWCRPWRMLAVRSNTVLQQCYITLYNVI